MMHKRLLYPQRQRRTPEQFSWVDHRLVRERRLEPCSAQAWALYLFLVTVADAKGLSYYSDASLTARLPLDRDRLGQARDELIGADLVAFEPPLYQVLSLDPGATSPRGAGPRSFAEVIRQMASQP